MARARRVEIVIGGDASGAARAFGTAGASARRFEASVKKTSTITSAAFGAMRTGAIALGIGLAGAAALGTKELLAEEKATAAVANTLRSTSNAAGVTTKQITNMAAAMQASTGLADDQVIAMQNLLLTFTKISDRGPDKIFTRATNAAADLSVQFNKSLSGSAIMVGKALNDPIRGITALGRAGVQFSDDQRAFIKSLVESGRVTEAQKVILGELEKQVGGAAKAFGQTRAGQVEKLKRSFEEMTEEVAGALLPAFDKIAPVLTKALAAVAPVLANVARSIADLLNTLLNNEGVRAFASAVGDGLSAALQGLANAARAVAPAIGGILGALAGIGRAVLGSTAGIAALTAALGAFAATKAVAVATQLVSSFKALAAVQVGATVVSGLRTLGPALVSATRDVSNFRGVTSQMGGAFGTLSNGASRFGFALKTSMAGVGTAMMGLAGGPIGLLVAGVGVAIGLFATFARRTDSNAAAMENLKNKTNEYTTALNNSKAAQAGFQQSSDRLVDAQLQQQSAAIAVKESERSLAQARASGDPLAVARAENSLAQARRQLDLANRSVASSQRGLTSSSVSAVTSLIRLASSTKTTKDELAKMAPSWHALTRLAAPKAFEQFQKDLVSVNAAGGTTESRLRGIQSAAAKMATQIKGTSPAANDARKALLSLANASPGQLTKFAADVEAGVKSGKTKAQAQRDAIAKLLKTVGNVSPEFSGYVAAIEAGGQAGYNAARKWAQKTRDELKKASPNVPGSPTVNSIIKRGYEEQQKVTRDGQTKVLNEVEKGTKKSREAQKKAAEALRQNTRSTAEGAVGTAFGAFRDRVLSGVDTNAKAGLGSYADRVGADGKLIVGRFNALSRELDKALSGVDSALNGRLAEIDRELAVKLKGIDDTAAALTPAEQALRDLESAAAGSDRAARVSDAQAKLSDATRIGDPALIAQAQRELAAAERETKIAELQTTAAAERAERDRIAAEDRAKAESDAAALRAAAETAAVAERQRISDDYEARRLLLEAEREADRISAEADLARLEGQMTRVAAILARGKKPAKSALAGIVKMFGEFGGDAGREFVTDLKTSLGNIDTAISRTLAARVKPYLELNSPAKKGPLSELDKWFTPFTDTLMSGVDTGALAASSARVAGAAMPGGRGGAGAGGVVVNVTVDGNQFDAREFARRLEPELARIVSATF
jgi:hypothetical protein